MKNKLRKMVENELCPSGTWHLTESMKSVLKLQMSRLPRNKVSETETRYPETAGGMRSFLAKFFVRHFFQVQDSLLDHMTSDRFVERIGSGELCILDIGSGTALASLAIAEIVNSITRESRCPRVRPLKRSTLMRFVLNDTSSICLGTGQRMLNDYFKLHKIKTQVGGEHKMTAIARAFPNNFQQLARIKDNSGAFDLVVLSYVILPLGQSEGLAGLTKCMRSLKKLCCTHGKVLVVQDKFNADVIRQIGHALHGENQKRTLTQEVFPDRHSNETQTYTYYCCLYDPDC